MAEKFKIIPLGGLNEIGKNMTVLEYGKDIIIVDCGLGFPEDDMYGVDLVIADMTYLVKNQNRIRGMFLTHGHEDHIGGIPYAMQQFKCPIHATRLTAGLVKLKLEEHRLLNKTKLITCEAGEVAASVFDRYRDPLYKQASFKPYIIAAMIFLAKVKDPAAKLLELEARGTLRHNG